MGIRSYNPTSPGRRGASVSDFAELTPGAEVPKQLRFRKRKTGGRNNQGKITARHRGGGHMQHYRLIDFRRNKDGVPGKVDSIQYDPNRTCRVALVHYADGEKRFILAPEGLKVGATVMSGADAAPFGRLGSRARRPRGAVGPAHAALWRNPPRARGLPGDDRRHRQLRAHERGARQGRPEALDGHSPDGARHGDESDRPPARRW